MTDHLTDARRAEIAARYAPPEPLACPICGADRVIGSSQWGIVKWACYSKAPGGGFHDMEHHAASVFYQETIPGGVADLLVALDAAEADRDAYHKRFSDVLKEHVEFMNDMLEATDVEIDEDGAYILDQIVTSARKQRERANAAETRCAELTDAIRSAISDHDRRDEISMVETLRRALRGAGEGSDA